MKLSSQSLACRAALALAAVAAALPSAAASDLLVRNARIVSAEADTPSAETDVWIRNGRIEAIGHDLEASDLEADQVLDAAGRFLAPGLIDSHVHLSIAPGMHPMQEAEFPEVAQAARAQIPRSFLYHGFTTIIDLIGPAETIERWNAQELRPQAYFCGAAPIVDGYPMNFLPKGIRYHLSPDFLYDPQRPEAFPDGFDPAAHSPEAIVQRIAASGAIGVKTFYEDGYGPVSDLPVPDIETLRELVAASRERNLPVLLHAGSETAQAIGLQAGVDAFAHGLWTWNRPDEPTLPPAITSILDAVIAQNIAWQPTIQVLYGERDLFNPDFLSRADLRATTPDAVIDWYRSEPGQWLARELANRPDIALLLAEGRWVEIDAEPIRHVTQALTYLASNGGRLLFGTDTPSAPTYANPAGLNGRLEMDRWMAAGVSPRALLRAATVANAAFFGLEKEIGSIAPGNRADLLLLRENPLDSVAAYDTIDTIILAGRTIDRASLAAPRP